jgi:two-component system KDP operon response regulator KdpE
VFGFAPLLSFRSTLSSRIIDHLTGEPLILVLEDDTHARRFLVSVLAAHGMRCMHAGTDAHLRSVLRHDHDLVLVDATALDTKRLDLVERLRARTAAPIVALLPPLDDHARAAVLEAGANDYVAHPFAMDDVIARIQVWLRHGAVAGPHRPRAHTSPRLRIDRERACIFVDGQEVHVTPIELKLLELLARAGEAGMSERKLCLASWGRGGDREVQTLRSHIRQLRTKIEPDPARPRCLVVQAWRTERAYRLELR